MQDLLRRPLVPLEMTEENKKVALVNELLMDKNNFVYIKRADGSFPSIQDIIIEYLGGSMVFRGFVNTRADLDKIDLDKRAIGDMWIVRKDETYKDPEDNTNIEYIVMEDTREDGTKYRYWECLGNPFARGIDESYPIYGSTKLITSTAVFEYTNNNFISAIKWNDDEDTITYTVGYQSSEDGKVKTKEITIGGSTHRKVESRPDQSKIKYITGTPTNDTNNDVLLFDSGVYIGKTPGEFNSKSFNTKAILVTDANESANSRTVINGTLLSTAAGVSVTHEKADFKVGNLGDSLYDLIINDKVLTSNSTTINLVGFNSFNAIGGENSTINLSSNIINIAHTSGKGLISMGFSTLRMNNNLYFEGSDKIYNLGSPIEINFDLADDQKQPVYLGTSNTTSIGRGSWIFGNKNDYNAEVDVDGVLDVSAGTVDKTSNIYDVFKANNKTGVSLYSKSSGTPVLLAQFTRSESDFYQNVNIANSKAIKLHKSGVADTGTDTILSLGNLKLVDTTSADNYTEYRYNKILSKIAFNIEAAAINIGNSVGTPISIGYKDSTGSIKSGSSWEEISLNGRVVLPKTETVLSEKADFGDIDDLYKFLSQLKKGLSEGLQSINSALALMGGGLDEVTDTTTFSEIVTAIKDFRAMTTEDSGDSGILYSTINGSSYRRAVNTIYGKDDGTIRAEIKQFSGKKDTTYTVTDKTLLTTSWKDNVLNWTSSKISRTGELSSIPKWSIDDTAYIITPNTTGGTSGRKTIVTAGRWWFKNNVVVKPVDETVTTYYTDTSDIRKAPVEGKIVDRDDADAVKDPYIGISIKEGYYNSSRYKIENPIIKFKITDINITMKPSIYGRATPSDVLDGKTFSSSLAGYNAKGSMPNNGAVNESLNCSGSYTIPEGYHNGKGKITANSLTSQTDASAIACNILEGNTAWVNGSKITGTMSDYIVRSASLISSAAFGTRLNSVSWDSLDPSNAILKLGLKCGCYGFSNLRDTTGRLSDQSYYVNIDSIGDYPEDIFGDAQVENVLSGVFFTSKAGRNRVGTMPEKNLKNSSDNNPGDNILDVASSHSWFSPNGVTTGLYSIKIPKAYYHSGNSDYKFYLPINRISLPSDIFGDLNASDAPSDKLFTSSNGLRIKGKATRRSAYTTIGTNYSAWNNGNSSLYVDIPDGLYNAHSSSGYNEGTLNVANIPFNNTTIFGDAQAAHVLKGATFTSGNAGRLSTGTMPSNGSVSKSLDFGETFIIPAGHHDGTGKVQIDSSAYYTNCSVQPTLRENTTAGVVETDYAYGFYFNNNELFGSDASYSNLWVASEGKISLVFENSSIRIGRDKRVIFIGNLTDKFREYMKEKVSKDAYWKGTITFGICQLINGKYLNSCVHRTFDFARNGSGPGYIWNEMSQTIFRIGIPLSRGTGNNEGGMPIVYDNIPHSGTYVYPFITMECEESQRYGSSSGSINFSMLLGLFGIIAEQ